MNRSFSEYSRGILISAKFIGGVHHRRDHFGDPNGRTPYAPVAADKQREALTFLQKYAFAENAFDRLFCNGSLEHFPDVRLGLKQIARILKSGAIAVLIVPNFYVKTEQPQEFRTHYWGWKRLMNEAGLQVVSTGIDWGPAVFKNANLKRAVARIIGKALCAIPFMQYQFIFTVRKS